MTTIVSSLWITLIGMTLVFIALAILWGLMEATVVGTAWYNIKHPEEEGDDEPEEVEEIPAAEEVLPATLLLKHQAAAAAVAVALAFQNKSPAGIEPQTGGYMGQPSAWKSVMRSAQITQRSNQFTRKSRGNVR